MNGLGANFRGGGVAVLAVLTAALAGCPVTQSQDTPVSEFKRVEPTTGISYWLYVPSTYTSEEEWSLVVTLHGTYGFDDGRAQVKTWKALAEQHQFIVMGPQLKSTQGILPVIHGLRVKDLEDDEKGVLAAVADVKRQYPRIHDDDTLLTGFSAGGYPLYFIGLRNPRVFSSLVSMSANCDLRILKTIPITDEVRGMPMLIYYGKTGVNPVYSHDNPVAQQAWGAYRYLKESHCREAKIRGIEGGHERRPDVAYEFWASRREEMKKRWHEASWNRSASQPATRPGKKPASSVLSTMN